MILSPRYPACRDPPPTRPPDRDPVWRVRCIVPILYLGIAHAIAHASHITTHARVARRRAIATMLQFWIERMRDAVRGGSAIRIRRSGVGRAAPRADARCGLWRAPHTGHGCSGRLISPPRTRADAGAGETESLVDVYLLEQTNSRHANTLPPSPGIRSQGARGSGPQASSGQPRR